jgi:hypothetical protein
MPIAFIIFLSIVGCVFVLNFIIYIACFIASLVDLHKGHTSSGYFPCGGDSYTPKNDDDDWFQQEVQRENQRQFNEQMRDFMDQQNYNNDSNNNNNCGGGFPF